MCFFGITLGLWLHSPHGLNKPVLFEVHLQHVACIVGHLVLTWLFPKPE